MSCDERQILQIAQAVRDTIVRWADCSYRQCRRAALIVDRLLTEAQHEDTYVEAGWVGRPTRAIHRPWRDTGHVWNIVWLDDAPWLLDVTADQFGPLLRVQFPPIVWGFREDMVEQFGYIPAEKHYYSASDMNLPLYKTAKHYLRTGRWLPLPPRTGRECRCSEAWLRRAGKHGSS